MPQLAWRPVRRVEARGCENGAERAADVPRPERGADAGGEHQVVVVSSVPSSLAELILAVAVEAEHGPEGRTKNDHWPQLPTLWRDEISSSYLNEVPKDNDGLANIFDILGSDYRGRIIVSIIAHDSWSGTRKLFYKRFLQHDVK